MNETFFTPHPSQGTAHMQEVVLRSIQKRLWGPLSKAVPRFEKPSNFRARKDDQKPFYVKTTKDDKIFGCIFRAA